MIKSRPSLRDATRAKAREPSFPSFEMVFGTMLFCALVVRLLFIDASGFLADVSSFMGWSLTLADQPLSHFYEKAGFADYPPGYFYILMAIGHVYRTFVHVDPDYDIMRVFVKLPGVLCDLAVSTLIYAIARRFTSRSWSFAAAALYAFNPATIFVSAYWGQVDSVAAAATLSSLLCMLVALEGERGRKTLWIAGSWTLLSYSILMKPPAIVVVPVYLAAIFMTDDARQRLVRLRGTALGIAAGLVLAFVLSLPFHPSANPVEVFAWLYGRYRYAAGVYPYNSVNAFNLYAMGLGSQFWVPDATLVPNSAVGLAQYVWGILFALGAAALVISRLVQRRDAKAILEAAAVLSLGYFVLSTRMHERYVFNALVFAILLTPLWKRYAYAAAILSVTFTANLAYTMYYQYVMTEHVAGVDGTNLVPWVSHPASFLNVASFFYLGYVYLGTGDDILERVTFGALLARIANSARRWFSPADGTAWMHLRDWYIASGLALASFVLTAVDYTWPSEKIFDEIYYARAGEEYLGHKEIFEFTHPPLTKLWITLSMILFGGLHGAGDTATGWRFLNLVMGAIMVLVLYVFAKRLLGTTLFATIAASLLLFDGFHYVQSRIATPEITVATLALLTLYAFYRFWLASQVRVARVFARKALRPQAIAFGVGLALAAIFSALVASGQDAGAHAVAFGYCALGAYLVARMTVPRFIKVAESVSYPEGSRIVASVLHTLDGGVVPLGNGTIVAGDTGDVVRGALVHEDEGVRIEYARSGTVQYATNGGGNAAFSPDGIVTAAGTTIDGRKDGLLWMFVLAASAGALGASKWNGFFDFFVVWSIALGVVLQALWAPLGRAVGRRNVVAVPATWGNPFGISFDLLVAAMLFIGATIYTLCYIPYFALGHNLSDLLGLQHEMFGYHYDLKATHPYGSKWYEWPLIGRPITYYYHDWRVGAETQNPIACCVAEIIALPNPAVWWLGLLSIPFVAVVGWRERNKGYIVLAVAYVLQWLPWITSPRVVFEYHFFPNLAVICLADAVLLQRVWQYAAKLSTERSVGLEANWVFALAVAFALVCTTVIGAYAIPFGIVVAAAGYYAVTRGFARWPQVIVGGYLALVVTVFVFFYPVLAGLHVQWDTWDARMWHAIMHNAWI